MALAVGMETLTLLRSFRSASANTVERSKRGAPLFGKLVGVASCDDVVGVDGG